MFETFIGDSFKDPAMIFFSILYVPFLGYAIYQIVKWEKGIHIFLWILLVVAFPIVGPTVYIAKRLLLEE